ncbi:hypothetical protein AB0M46_19885 [Dactylosporangium sp. NPDC051485]|uniref:hypothetical protein n=1 Tax=Dactylosporangium sp. NPDC051485 TaxID=3154846 RepID=UPI003437AA06
MITRVVVWCAAAGLVLGLTAYAGDELDGLAGTILHFAAGSGFAWGCAGLLAGYLLRPRRASAAGAVALLVAATVAYYTTYAVTGVRWYRMYHEDGTSAAPDAMRNLALAAAFWLVASVAGGAVLGLLGHAIRRGPARFALAATGLAFVLLAGAGRAISLDAIVPACVAAVVLLSLRPVLRST